MSRTIQIRNVPDDVHEKLKARAARQGRSLSAMLLRELTRFAETLTVEEFTERIRKRERAAATEGQESLGDISAETIVGIIREARGPLPSE